MWCYAIKLHLMCLLAHGMHCNTLCNASVVQACGLSLLSSMQSIDIVSKWTVDNLANVCEQLVSRFDGIGCSTSILPKNSVRY